MNKRVLYTVVAVGLAVTAGWSLLGPKPPTAPKPEIKQEEKALFGASISVTNADETVTEYKITEETTALEAVRKAAQVETKGEGVSAFVTSINGRKADEAKKEYWAFYINDKPSAVGAGSYTIKNGDKIIWKIEKY